LIPSANLAANIHLFVVAEVKKPGGELEFHIQQDQQRLYPAQWTVVPK
jgi:hypothetical protein